MSTLSRDGAARSAAPESPAPGLSGTALRGAPSRDSVDIPTVLRSPRLMHP